MVKRRGRGLWLISFLVSVACLAWVGQANAAPLDFNQLLRGEYAFTGESVCLVSTNGFVINPFGNFVPNPPTTVWVFSFSVQGVWTFDGDGTGRAVARSVGVTYTSGMLGSSAADLSGDFTYEVAPDRTFTVDHGPVTTTAVPPATGTATITGLKFSGRISHDSETLVMATEESTVETRTTGSDTDYRICHRAKTGIKIK